MIKVVHPHFDEPLTLESATPFVLVIENPSEFYKTVCDLQKQFEGEEGDFIFLTGDKEADFSEKGFFISNIFSIDFENKKLTNALYKSIEKDYNIGDKILKLNELNSEISDFIRSLTYDYGFDTDYDELTLPILLKAVNLHAFSQYNTYIEKLICFLNFVTELKHVDFFVIVNLKNVLDDKSLCALYSHCEAEKISLLLIESNNMRGKLMREKQKIITEDLCEIIVN